MQKNIVKVLFFIIISFSLFNCADPPKSIGLGLLDSDLINVVKINSKDDSLYQTSSYYKKQVQLGTAERLLLGKKHNVEASLLLQFNFNLPDSIKEDLLNNNLNVISANIEMSQNYLFGDSLAAFDFTTHKINSDWSINFDADSLPFLDYDIEDVAAGKLINDSVTSFNISNQLIQSWLLAAADENIPRDKGIYLKPTGETDKVRGYQALTITFSNLPVIRVGIEKPGVYTDTLTFNINVDVGVVKGDIPVISDENILVQGGLVINSRLFFDISKIPRTAVINNAELVLTIDSTESVLGPDAIQLLQAVYLLDSTNTDSLSVLVSTLSSSEGKLQSNITSFVYRWFTDANHGLILRVFEQLNTLELFSIRGSSAIDPSVKPYLEITYTNIK